MSWTLARNMVVTRGAGVLDVDNFTPKRVVAGCKTEALPEYDGASPIPADVFAKMKAYSDSEGGVGLVVMVDGKIAGEAYRDGMSQATVTQSYSMHKSVLGLLYGVALDEGVIGSLDDPIGTYIDEWADDPRGEITLRAFLTMSSGLRPPSFTEDFMEAMQFLLSHKVTQEALELEPEFEPFEQFWYKNTDSQLAGAALNRALKAAGKGNYTSYLQEKIWCPIGAGEALMWPESKKGDPRFFAYLDATARDWARVGQLILEDGKFMGAQVLPEGWIDTYASPSKTNPNYGLQVWLSSPYVENRRYNPPSPVTVLQSAPHLADDVIYFDGFGGQRVYVVRSAGLVISRSGDVSATWDDAILVNLALEALQAPAGLGR